SRTTTPEAPPRASVRISPADWTLDPSARKPPVADSSQVPLSMTLSAAGCALSRAAADSSIWAPSEVLPGPGSPGFAGDWFAGGVGTALRSAGVEPSAGRLVSAGAVFPFVVVAEAESPTAIDCTTMPALG